MTDHGSVSSKCSGREPGVAGRPVSYVALSRGVSSFLPVASSTWEAQIKTMSHSAAWCLLLLVSTLCTSPTLHKSESTCPLNHRLSSHVRGAVVCSAFNVSTVARTVVCSAFNVKTLTDELCYCVFENRRFWKWRIMVLKTWTWQGVASNIWSNSSFSISDNFTSL